jgi:hypothetical protein
MNANKNKEKQTADETQTRRIKLRKATWMPIKEQYLSEIHLRKSALICG